MFFRKRGGLLQNKSWTYTGIVLDIDDELNYLWTVLNYTCNVSRNQDQLIGKALKALGILTTNIKNKWDLDLNFFVNYLKPLFNP